PPPRSTLFPYTTLFRSQRRRRQISAGNGFGNTHGALLDKRLNRDDPTRRPGAPERCRSERFGSQLARTTRPPHLDRGKWGLRLPPPSHAGSSRPAQTLPLRRSDAGSPRPTEIIGVPTGSMGHFRPTVIVDDRDDARPRGVPGGRESTSPGAPTPGADPRAGAATSAARSVVLRAELRSHRSRRRDGVRAPGAAARPGRPGTVARCAAAGRLRHRGDRPGTGHRSL